MEYVIGDIHGAGLELEALLMQLDKATRIYAVGDLFTRGIAPYTVWELIHDFGITSVMGNHEARMLDFLEGRRSNLPPHYYFAMNHLMDKGVGRKKLVRYLKKMPRILHLTSHEIEYIIAHAGVDPKNPLNSDPSITVYGGDWETPWYDRYQGDPVVMYGHTCEPYPETHLPRIRNGKSGGINSIGLDTGAVHGVALTAYCLDGFDFVQVPVQWDYAEVLKASLELKGKKWREEMRDKLWLRQ